MHPVCAPDSFIGASKANLDRDPGALDQLPSGRLQPSNHHTLKPCATPASGANSTHPSPSARQFRLPFNGLAPSELRRIFCSDETPLMRETSARQFRLPFNGLAPSELRRIFCADTKESDLPSISAGANAFPEVASPTCR